MRRNFQLIQKKNEDILTCLNLYFILTSSFLFWNLQKVIKKEGTIQSFVCVSQKKGNNSPANYDSNYHIYNDNHPFPISETGLILKFKNKMSSPLCFLTPNFFQGMKVSSQLTE